MSLLCFKPLHSTKHITGKLIRQDFGMNCQSGNCRSVWHHPSQLHTLPPSRNHTLGNTSKRARHHQKLIQNKSSIQLTSNSKYLSKQRTEEEGRKEEKKKKLH